MDAQSDYTRIPAELTDDEAIGIAEKAVYQAIARFTPANGNTAYPGQRRLCTMLNISNKVLRRALKNLELRGWLVIEKKGNGRGKRSLYRLNSTIKGALRDTLPNEKGALRDTLFEKGCPEGHRKGALRDTYPYVITRKRADGTILDGTAAFQKQTELDLFESRDMVLKSLRKAIPKTGRVANGFD